MRYVIGIDEAGRGPLAGPVSVGVFAAPVGFNAEYLKGIRDSKRMSAQERDRWYERLTHMPHVRYAVAFASARYIDTYGIVPAVRKALREALRRTGIAPHRAQVLLDGGLYAPPAYTTQRTIIRGDATEPLISAAAVLAKVRRDRLMQRLDKQAPQYGFSVHKGYGTAAHRSAIARFGPSKEHRRSFIH